jgi:hypothetical protein
MVRGLSGVHGEMRICWPSCSPFVPAEPGPRIGFARLFLPQLYGRPLVGAHTHPQTSTRMRTHTSGIIECMCPHKSHTPRPPSLTNRARAGPHIRALRTPDRLPHRRLAPDSNPTSTPTSMSATLAYPTYHPPKQGLVTFPHASCQSTPPESPPPRYLGHFHTPEGRPLSALKPTLKFNLSPS